MPDFRRAFLPGGKFFFTVVTYKRQCMHCRFIIHCGIEEIIVHMNNSGTYKVYSGGREWE